MESVYQTRRARLTADLQDGDVFVLFSGDSETPSILPSDPKTVSKNFIYLTGLCENDLVLVIIRSGGAVREALFVPARSDMEAFYMGKTKDLDYYRQRGGIQNVDYRYHLDSYISMEALTNSIGRLVLACPNRSILTRPTLEACFARKMLNSFPHLQVVDKNYEILCMRQFKDAQEIEAIQKAVDLTGLAIVEAMKKTRDGMTESQVRALCDYTARMHGASGTPEGVVAAGANGVILHYEDSDGVFRRGELAMVDLCVEYNHYVSDITRTFPVEGRFTERQAYWYDLCLRAQESIVAHMKPGADMRACGAEAREMVAKALMDNGYIQSPEELPAMIGQCRKDYVTVTGVNHSIGLQCDEVGTRSRFQTLQPGMVYTVEPGIYLGSEGIGIRIEDDYLVTEDGIRCLSAGIPKTIPEIEALREGSHEDR